MAIRIDVLEPNNIEVLHSTPERNYFLYFKTIEDALTVARFLMKRAALEKNRERFISQLDKEANQELKKLEEKNPYGKR